MQAFGPGQATKEHLELAQGGAAKKVQLQQHIEREKHKLTEWRTTQNMRLASEKTSGIGLKG